MNHRTTRPPDRHGFSLLELIVAAGMMGVLMASVSVLIRTSYGAWTAHEADMERTENAYGVLRHVVRQLRQATGVTAISAPTDLSGSITATNAAGDSLVWDHNAGTKEVLHGITTASDLLAEQIEELTFVGYEKDGVTTTTVPADVQRVKCIVKVILPHGAGEARTFSCQAWIRRW